MLSGQRQKPCAALLHKVNWRRQFFSPFCFVNVEFVSLQVCNLQLGEEPGGLKDLMEQSVWISCRIFVRLESSTVVLLSPSLSLSLRPCGWLLHIYKSPGTQACVPERARWASLGSLITLTSLRPICSSQMITKHTLWGMIPLACEFCSYHALTVMPHERAARRWGWLRSVWVIVTNHKQLCLGCLSNKNKARAHKAWVQKERCCGGGAGGGGGVARGWRSTTMTERHPVHFAHLLWSQWSALISFCLRVWWTFAEDGKLSKCDTWFQAYEYKSSISVGAHVSDNARMSLCIRLFSIRCIHFVFFSLSLSLSSQKCPTQICRN